jgi:hypothetical protein
MARPRRKLNQRTQESVRQQIEAGKLIELLQNHALTNTSSLSDSELRVLESRMDKAKFLLTRVISPPVPKGDDGKQPTGPTIYTWQS